MLVWIWMVLVVVIRVNISIVVYMVWMLYWWCGWVDMKLVY